MTHPIQERKGALALCLAAALFASASLSAQTAAKVAPEPATPSWKRVQDPNKAEPFWGEHQGGIVTPPQHHLYFAAFDLVTANREDVVKLLRAWTAAAARMTGGDTAQPMESGLKLAVPRPPVDLKRDEDAYGSPDPARPRPTPARPWACPRHASPSLSVSVRVCSSRMARTVTASPRAVPRRSSICRRFAGDQMVEGHTGGDLAIQVCAEDSQVAFHAVRQLARIAEGVAQIRWAQIGYRPATGERHLLGFSNGKGNPPVDDADAMNEAVWVGREGGWMRGGTYIVVRRIRFAIEHWDHMPQAYQEKAVGETKHPGMPSDRSTQSEMPEDENRHDPPEDRLAWCPHHSATLVFVQRRRQFHRRTLAALETGPGI